MALYMPSWSSTPPSPSPTQSDTWDLLASLSSGDAAADDNYTKGMDSVQFNLAEENCTGSPMCYWSINDTVNAQPAWTLHLWKDAFRVFGGAFCAIIITLTLTGNLLVIVAVAAFTRLRSVTNLIMASLALADITVAALVMPYLLIYDVVRTWGFGFVFCHIWISCDVMCCTASILHLCVIAVDRYCAITDPLRYKTVMSKRRAVALIFAAWFCSAAISFVPIMLGWYSSGSEENSAITGVNECQLNVNPVYAVVSSLISFYLPSPIMIYVYTKIFIVAQRQSREIKRMQFTIHHSSKSEQRRFKRQSLRVTSDTKAIKTLGIIMGAFCICWLPFFLMYVILPFCPSCSLSYEAKSAITWLGYFNSSLNPCVYGLRSAEFRSAFWRTLKCDFGNERPRRDRCDSRSSIIMKSVHSISSFELETSSRAKSTV